MSLIGIAVAQEVTKSIAIPSLALTFIFSERPSPGESPVVPPEPRDFRVGDLVWGPAHGFPSWPGKLVRGSGERAEGKVWVCWFGTRDLSEVEGHRLKTLSEGLEAHHRERKKSRRWAI